MSDINAKIDEQVKSNDVFLYMKGTKDFPMCGFSGRAISESDSTRSAITLTTFDSRSSLPST